MHTEPRAPLFFGSLDHSDVPVVVAVTRPKPIELIDAKIFNSNPFGWCNCVDNLSLRILC